MAGSVKQQFRSEILSSWPGGPGLPPKRVFQVKLLAFATRKCGLSYTCGMICGSSLQCVTPGHVSQAFINMPLDREITTAGGASSDTPVLKKRKLSASPLLATPTRVLEQVKNVRFETICFALVQNLKFAVDGPSSIPARWR